MANYKALASSYEKEFGIPAGLLGALIQQESGWNPNARSPVGAIGLSQLMPGTAKGLQVDPYNPEQNLRGGAKYLSQQLKAFGGDIPKALAAYNAGPGAVQKYKGVPPYRETQNYVKRVQQMMRSLNPVPTERTVQQPSTVLSTLAGKTGQWMPLEQTKIAQEWQPPAVANNNPYGPLTMQGEFSPNAGDSSNFQIGELAPVTPQEVSIEPTGEPQPVAMNPATNFQDQVTQDYANRALAIDKQYKTNTAPGKYDNALMILAGLAGGLLGGRLLGGSGGALLGALAPLALGVRNQNKQLYYKTKAEKDLKDLPGQIEAEGKVFQPAANLDYQISRNPAVATAATTRYTDPKLAEDRLKNLTSTGTGVAGFDLLQNNINNQYNQTRGGVMGGVAKPGALPQSGAELQTGASYTSSAFPEETDPTMMNSIVNHIGTNLGTALTQGREAGKFDLEFPIKSELDKSTTAKNNAETIIKNIQASGLPERQKAELAKIISETNLNNRTPGRGQAGNFSAAEGKNLTDLYLYRDLYLNGGKDAKGNDVPRNPAMAESIQGIIDRVESQGGAKPTKPAKKSKTNAKQEAAEFLRRN